MSYLNSEGGTAPTYETDGHAFREQFNPSDGHYRFQTSQAGTAGSAVTWENAMRILPGGKIGANEYCDINGNNCASAPLGGSGPSGSTVVPGWPDAIYCSIDTNVVLGGSSFNMAVLTLDDLSPGGDGYFYYKADSVNQVYNPDGSWNSGPQGDCYGLSIEELAAAGKAFSFGVTEFVPTLLDRKSFNTRGEVTAEFVSVSLAQGTDWCGLGMCPGAIHSNERGREEFCKMTLPGSVPLYYSDTAYHSPGNNSVALWDDGAGGWVYGNASNYNRLISTITCAK